MQLPSRGTVFIVTIGCGKEGGRTENCKKYRVPKYPDRAADQLEELFVKRDKSS